MWVAITLAVVVIILIGVLVALVKLRDRVIKTEQRGLALEEQVAANTETANNIIDDVASLLEALDLLVNPDREKVG